jgi:hypothetical protein
VSAAELLDGAAPLEGMPDIDDRALLATDPVPASARSTLARGRPTRTDPDATPPGSRLTPTRPSGTPRRP